MGTVMAGKRKEQAAATRRKLEEAGRRLLSEKGYDGFTIADITAACGVSAGTFYNHFKSKEHLQGWLQYEPYLRLDEELVADNRPIKECIASYMIAWIDYFSTYSPHFAASWLGRTNNENELLLDDYKDQYGSEYDVAMARVDSVAERLRRAVAEGELSVNTPVREVAFSIGTRLYGLCVWHALSDGKIDITIGVRKEAELVKRLLDLYGPEDGEPRLH